MSINWTEKHLYAVFIDGEKVCQVYGVNNIHAVWKAKSTVEFSNAVKKFENKTYVVTACRISDQEVMPE